MSAFWIPSYVNHPKAGVAVVEGKVFVMGGLITTGEENGRYYATAKVERKMARLLDSLGVEFFTY